MQTHDLRHGNDTVQQAAVRASQAPPITRPRVLRHASAAPTAGGRGPQDAADDLAEAFVRLDHAAAEADIGELPALIGRLVSVEERARLRLRQATPSPAPGPVHDENLSAADAARRLGISKDWLYRNAKQLPFAARIGRRVVFSASGLERWSRQRSAR